MLFSLYYSESASIHTIFTMKWCALLAALFCLLWYEILLRHGMIVDVFVFAFAFAFVLACEWMRCDGICRFGMTFHVLHTSTTHTDSNGSPALVFAESFVWRIVFRIIAHDGRMNTTPNTDCVFPFRHWQNTISNTIASIHRRFNHYAYTVSINDAVHDDTIPLNVKIHDTRIEGKFECQQLVKAVWGDWTQLITFSHSSSKFEL